MMSEFAAQQQEPVTGEAGRDREVDRILTDELARSDRALRGVTPVLTHLLAGTEQTLVSDAIVARLRGMLSSLARQLLAAGSGTRQPVEDRRKVDLLSDRLAGDSAVLSYCYSLAMEAQMIERLEQRASVDPVLSPLMQELIASESPAIAELAMATLAAQSRFVQSQRRMDLTLAELPAECLHAVLKRWEDIGQGDASAPTAISALKSGYDEGSSRVGLLARLVSGMRGGAVAALEIEHAGLSLFVTALAALSGQPRDLTVLACHSGQSARLALTLRAAGLGDAAISRQFDVLGASERLPADISLLSPDRARAMLRSLPSEIGG